MKKTRPPLVIPYVQERGSEQIHSRFRSAAMSAARPPPSPPPPCAAAAAEGGRDRASEGGSEPANGAQGARLGPSAPPRPPYPLGRRPPRRPG